MEIVSDVELPPISYDESSRTFSLYSEDAELIGAED